MKNDISLAASFFSRAMPLRGEDSDLPTRARILDAQGDPDGAIRLLRDEPDPDARSTLLSLLSRRKGTDEALAWLTDAKLSSGDLTVNGVHTTHHAFTARRQRGARRWRILSLCGL